MKIAQGMKMSHSVSPSYWRVIILDVRASQLLLANGNFVSRTKHKITKRGRSNLCARPELKQ